MLTEDAQTELDALLPEFKGLEGEELIKKVWLECISLRQLPDLAI